MARTFNGTTDKISVPAHADYNNLQTFTAWGWFKLAGNTASGTHYIVAKNNGDRVYLGLLDASNKRLLCSVGRATTATQYRSPALAFLLGEWTFCAATFDDSRGDGARVELFLGSAPGGLTRQALTVTTEGVGAILDDTAGALSIGGRISDQTRDFNGDLAAVGLASTVLTFQEIAGLVRDTMPASVRGRWLLAETGSPTTAVDASGRGHDGTYTGTTDASGAPTTYVGTGVPTTCVTCTATDRSVRFAFRMNSEADVAVKIRIGTASDLSGATDSAPITVTSATDWSGTIDVTGLTANTVYYYAVVAAGVQTESSGFRTVRTFPTAGQPAAFSFAFGSCAAHTSAGTAASDAVFDVVPVDARLLLHLGDTVYTDIDTPPAADLLASYRAKHRDALAGGTTFTDGWARIRRRLPTYTMWDDHEIGNNWDSGQAGRWVNAYQAWGEYHGRANPASGGAAASPLYYHFEVGDVAFFVCDGRSYRSAAATTDTAAKTILGTQQLADLKSWLLSVNRTHRLKIICSPTSLHGYGATGGDAWGGAAATTQFPGGANGYRAERNALWDWIDSNRILGVIALSGDQHWSGSFKTSWRARPRFEFQSSPFNRTMLAPVATTPDPVNGPVYWVYGTDNNVGIVSVDTTVSPATIEFQLYNAAGSLGASYRTAITTATVDSGLTPVARPASSIRTAAITRTAAAARTVRT